MAKKPTATKKKAAATKNRKSVSNATGRNNAKQQFGIDLLNPNYVKNIKKEINDSMEAFEEMSKNNLTAAERRRKVGAGTKNYGFIDKVSDIASEKTEYAQLFSITDLKSCIRNIEDCRDIVLLLQSFARMVGNAMIVYSDAAYSMALLYYNSVKEMSRRGDPNAMEIYRDLQQFFHRPRHSSDKPTIKGTERNLDALLNGTRSGEIYVEGEKAQTIAGKRKIVDKTQRNRRGAINRALTEETEDGEVE
jgi:hypothetical protein